MNKDNIGLTLQQRFDLEISDENVMAEFDNVEYQMNKFTVVKYGADLKSKVKSRVEAKVV